MGNTQKKFNYIPDRHSTLIDVQAALKKAGLEGSNLIFAIDYTSSNAVTGEKSFNNMSLHTIDSMNLENPYQKVIKCIGETLEPFDEDKLIPVYGFGDIHTKNTKVFNLKQRREPCKGFQEVIEVYNKITPNILLSGPTSYAPIIRHAINIVKQCGSYHILIIVTDGAVVDKQNTIESIIEASKYPLSIVAIGVGDGPFETMEEFDDSIPKRDFDNFQFVDFNKVQKRALKNETTFMIQFAVDALQEIPDQYTYLKNNNLISIQSTNNLDTSYEFIKENTPDSQEICNICFVNQLNNTLDPCGHRLCSKCINYKEKQIDICPFCRTKVNKVIKNFN
jgi:E3 ubiquitin-protein ligase RGLG